jgi:hypothetical protein
VQCATGANTPDSESEVPQPGSKVPDFLLGPELRKYFDTNFEGVEPEFLNLFQKLAGVIIRRQVPAIDRLRVQCESAVGVTKSHAGLFLKRTAKKACVSPVFPTTFGDRAESTTAAGVPSGRPDEASV